LIAGGGGTIRKELPDVAKGGGGWGMRGHPVGMKVCHFGGAKKKKGTPGSTKGRCCVEGCWKEGDPTNH